MREILLLLRPKLQGARNAYRRHGRQRARALFLASLGLLFWAGTFATTWRGLLYLEHVPDAGVRIAKALLGFCVPMCFGILLYSNLIVGLSVFLLSRDLHLVFGTPARLSSVFYSKLLEMLAASSWMILLFLTPILLGYGAVFEAPLSFYLASPLLMLFFFLLSTVLGVILIIVLANVFPARRLRDLLFLVMLAGVTGLVFYIRYLRPEMLIRPDVRASALEYLLALDRTGAIYLPSTWLTEVFAGFLGITKTPPHDLWLFAFLLVSTPLALLFFAEALASRFYFRGWSRSLEAKRISEDEGAVPAGTRVKAFLANIKALQIFPFLGRRTLELFCRGLARLLGALVPGVHRPLVEKDLLVFFRDTAQWSQLLLVLGIAAIYVLNMYLIKLSGGIFATGFDLTGLKSVISFLNIGMIGFVLSTLCLRFAFPAVSLEGEAFWLLRSSPISVREILRSKLWTYLPPLLVLGLLLVVLSNYFLEVHPFISWLGLGTVLFMTFAVCALAVGLGARYPDFRYENAARLAMSYGGVLYMLLSMSYVGVVIVLEALPVYLYLSNQSKGFPLDRLDRAAIAVSLGAVALVTAAVIWIPLQRGRAALEDPG
ncbi:MAG: hypothetical protein AB1405_00615 [Bdellovibrionota bacterium]